MWEFLLPGLIPAIIIIGVHIHNAKFEKERKEYLENVRYKAIVRGNDEIAEVADRLLTMR